MPHEDRCSLASAILELILDDTGVQIPTICVASWREKSCNAFFFVLAKVQPSTRILQMVPRGEKFTVEAAADGLMQLWRTLIFEPADRVREANQLLRWCVEDQEEMVAEAVKRGMEEVVDAVPGAPLSGSGVATAPSNTEKRSLSRLNTDEEYQRVMKNNERC